MVAFRNLSHVELFPHCCHRNTQGRPRHTLPTSAAGAGSRAAQPNQPKAAGRAVPCRRISARRYAHASKTHHDIIAIRYIFFLRFFNKFQIYQGKACSKRVQKASEIPFIFQTKKHVQITNQSVPTVNATSTQQSNTLIATLERSREKFVCFPWPPQRGTAPHLPTQR